MDFAVVIPARYASTRFPGKPLATLGGKPIIVRVCERAASTGLPVYVATDDERILECVQKHGYKGVMTRADHHSGTDRINEAVIHLGLTADVIINIQGDEPFISTRQIEALENVFKENPDTDIATLVQRFKPEAGFEALFSPNLVKVVFDEEGKALYFSRSIIPYVRGTEWQLWLDTTDFYTHIGVYAYRRHVLALVTELPPSSLERAESLEQLRWLQAGYNIKVAETDSSNIGIDTPEDLAEAEKMLKISGTR